METREHMFGMSSSTKVASGSLFGRFAFETADEKRFTISNNTEKRNKAKKKQH